MRRERRPNKGLFSIFKIRTAIQDEKMRHRCIMQPSRTRNRKQIHADQSWPTWWRIKGFPPLKTDSQILQVDSTNRSNLDNKLKSSYYSKPRYCQGDQAKYQFTRQKCMQKPPKKPKNVRGTLAEWCTPSTAVQYFSITSPMALQNRLSQTIYILQAKIRPGGRKSKRDGHPCFIGPIAMGHESENRLQTSMTQRES